MTIRELILIGIFMFCGYGIIVMFNSILGNKDE